MAIHNVEIGSDHDGNGRTSLLPNSNPSGAADYRVPVGKKWAITTILFCNTGIADPDTPNSDLTFLSLHFVKGGDPAGDKNLVLNAIPIPGGETFTFDTEKLVLEAGDTIVTSGQAPANLVMTISYLEV